MSVETYRPVILAVECALCGRSWTQHELAPRLIECSWCHQRQTVIVKGWEWTVVSAALNARPLEELGRPLREGHASRWGD